ncbi:hypothetical protein CYMTET_34959 [Cymbomonas tetramitiformis]|uniref:Uncharacterized protein n=1 Tax=Cymbomonas tetramitiformis TaxID=36881 RepID=A0AAE0FA28_9CHLO|nr:hypothetical protein CYMTET_34959 [Cymbomonas tetramitiformis]
MCAQLSVVLRLILAVCGGFMAIFSTADVLPWREFSVTVAKKNIPKLDEILDAIMPDQILKMQNTLACVWPRLHMSSYWGPYADEDSRFDMFDTLMQLLYHRILPAEPQTTWAGKSSTCQLPPPVRIQTHHRI